MILTFYKLISQCTAISWRWGFHCFISWTRRFQSFTRIQAPFAQLIFGHHYFVSCSLGVSMAPPSKVLQWSKHSQKQKGSIPDQVLMLPVCLQKSSKSYYGLCFPMKFAWYLQDSNICRNNLGAGKGIKQWFYIRNDLKQQCDIQ